MNFIRQHPLPYDPNNYYQGPPVAQNGSQASIQPVQENGALFKLLTRDSKGTTYPLAETKVGTFLPAATVTIVSEDPYLTYPRTRADRPFGVQVTVSGLKTGTDPVSGTAYPEAAGKVRLTHAVMAYPAGTHGLNVTRNLNMVADTYITNIMTGTEPAMANLNLGNGTTFYTSVPGANLAKREGEEKFVIYGLPAGSETEPTPLDDVTVQVWPVADGSITGVTNNQYIRYSMPAVKFKYNDLYPSSETYVQVYKGSPRLGVTGTPVPGSGYVVKDTIPHNKEVTISDWTGVFVGEDGVQTADDDGQWTMEVVTKTPFGLDRLAYVSFNVDLTIEVNSSVNNRETATAVE